MKTTIATRKATQKTNLIKVHVDLFSLKKKKKKTKLRNSLEQCKNKRKDKIAMREKKMEVKDMAQFYWSKILNVLF